MSKVAPRDVAPNNLINEPREAGLDNAAPSNGAPKTLLPPLVFKAHGNEEDKARALTKLHAGASSTKYVSNAAADNVPVANKNGVAFENAGGSAVGNSHSAGGADSAVHIQNYVPFRYGVLHDLLIQDHSGWFSGEAGGVDKGQFLQLCKWISVRNTVSFEMDYCDMLDRYAALDPDVGTIQSNVATLDADGRAQLSDEVLRELREVMECGEFTQVSAAELERAQNEKSVTGFHMSRADPELLDSKFWFRGSREKEVLVTYLFFFTRVTRIRVFDRLVLAFRLLRPVEKDDEPLRQIADTRPFWRQMWETLYPPLGLDGLRDDYLYLKIFKDVPACDLDMLLPGSDVSLTWFDMAMIWVPILVGLGAAIQKAIMGTFSFRDLYQVLTSVLLIAIPLSWGIRAYLSYKARREEYRAHLDRVLRMHCLGSNAGVMSQLLIEAQEQEDNEVMLAYFFLWRGQPEPQPTRSTDLDKAVEAYLQDKLVSAGVGTQVDFEVSDALTKLLRLGLVVKVAHPSKPSAKREEEEWYTAVPLAKALELAHVKHFDESRELGVALGRFGNSPAV